MMEISHLKGSSLDYDGFMLTKGEMEGMGDERREMGVRAADLG